MADRVGLETILGDQRGKGGEGGEGGGGRTEDSYGIIHLPPPPTPPPFTNSQTYSQTRGPKKTWSEKEIEIRHGCTHNKFSWKTPEERIIR